MPAGEYLGGGDRRTVARILEIREKAGQFFAQEGAAAVLVPSGNNASGGRSGGTIAVDTNYTFGLKVYERTRAMRAPLLVLAVEHYGRMERLLERKETVRLELAVDTGFTARDVDGLN